MATGSSPRTPTAAAGALAPWLTPEFVRSEKNCPGLAHGRRLCGQQGAMVSDGGDSAAGEVPAVGHQPPHGRLRPWALVWVVIAALYVGGVAVIGHRWVLFWAWAAVVVLSVPAGRLIVIMSGREAARQAPRVRARVP